MQNSLLLQQELHQLYTSKRHQNKKKRATQVFIQDGGSLTGDQGLQMLRKREVMQEPSSRSQQPAQCSNCNQEGHDRLKCPKKQ